LHKSCNPPDFGCAITVSGCLSCAGAGIFAHAGAQETFIAKHFSLKTAPAMMLALHARIALQEDTGLSVRAEIA